jgi:hypothetical protein
MSGDSSLPVDSVPQSPRKELTEFGHTGSK